MQRIPNSSPDGFTLIETVVATGILVTALAGLAQLLALSVRSTRNAGSQSAALIAAQDKIEALRALAFAYDVAGAPVTAPELILRASLSLREDTTGLVDYLDAAGAIVNPDDDDSGVVFTRRWRITPLDLFVPEAIAIEVCVFHWSADGPTLAAAEACLATVRARQP
jgi:type II secretory pathway pseudopilin PulG